MKIVDKTPLVDESGKLGFVQRVQGILQFGLNWQVELQVQNVIVTFFDRNLDKGYTLLRNVTLGQSGIMIPITLVGPAGIFVINLVYARGNYEASGDSWNVESGNQYKPARVNLIQETARMARALQSFIERQGIKLPVAIEPVLVAGDPGVHLVSTKPAIRVILIDGIKSFVAGLGKSGPVLNALTVNEFVDRILEPRQARKTVSPASASRAIPPAREEQPQPTPPASPQNVSRARAIFDASEEAKPFNPSDFDFATDDGEQPDLQALQNIAAQKPVVEKQVATSSSPRRRILGMTTIQLAILVALGLCFICVLVIGFVYVIPLVS
jgi:hypothetical protein